MEEKQRNRVGYYYKMNNKRHRKYISNYENQREYTKDFLESLYAN